MVPEKTINEFLRRVQQAAASNLESLILYGSAVSGDFNPEFSNLNLLLVVRDPSLAALQALEPAIEWWTGQKQPPPLIVTARELGCSTDVFPIEFMDMQQHHRVLFGDDPIAGLQISPQLHRNQVEYELREKLILLRQHVILAKGKETRLWDLLLRSASSIVTLFRHAHIALGNASLPRRDAVRALGDQVGFDASAVEQVLDLRERKMDSRKLDVRDLLSKYLASVEQVIAAVDQAEC